jgi:hypothetical protein
MITVMMMIMMKIIIIIIIIITIPREQAINSLQKTAVLGTSHIKMKVQHSGT